MGIRASMVFAPCALAALALSAPTSPFNASVSNGILSAPGAPPCALGNTTSALSAALASLFGGLAPAQATPLKNSTSFYSYFVVDGQYAADAPLHLLPGVALAFNPAALTAITVASSFSASAAVINATNAPGSAVIAAGGAATARIDCPAGGPAPLAVEAAQSAGFVLDGLSMDGCAGVHVRGKPFCYGAEVANCVITNSQGRGVWTETVSGVAIHGNWINNTLAHTIDFDAYSANSIAYNNTVSFSVEEAVFIEQGASNIVVVDNDLGPGNRNGLSVCASGARELCASAPPLL